MITAVDTNVLLDVFLADAAHGQTSRRALRESRAVGGLVASDVVWAEIAARFDDPADVTEAMDALGVTFSAMSATSAAMAGKAWRSYRRRGGVRGRMVADFLIGAHARHQADRLLTRDRGFYRSYFRDLTVVDPTRR